MGMKPRPKKRTDPQVRETLVSAADRLIETLEDLLQPYEREKAEVVINVAREAIYELQYANPNTEIVLKSVLQAYLTPDVGIYHSGYEAAFTKKYAKLEKIIKKVVEATGM
jgi:hypothetical protein